MKSTLLLFSYLILLLASCKQVPDNIEFVLAKAGTNRPELEKVIKHYKSTGEDEKLNAAFFLISNMQDKYSLDGDQVRNFDVIFDILDSLHKKNTKIPAVSPVFQAQWDSVTNVYGKPMLIEAEEFEDYKFLNANYLIENIDLAFKQWKDNKFTKQISFEEFCEYILPYRRRSERIEPWRKHLVEEFGPFRDTVQAANRFEFAKKLNYRLKDLIYLNHTIRAYPFSMAVSQMEKGKRGACTHLVSYTAAVMRANGMPVGVDHSPRWGDLDRGHEWNTLLLENGKIFPFDAGASTFGGPEKTPYRLSKVYRTSFAKQNIELPPEKDVPKHLQRPYDIDVTSEYTKTYDITVPLTKAFKGQKRHAVISTFGRRNWEPQDWGIITNNSSRFKNIGANLLYIVMYYDHGKYYPASDPFILDKKGKLNYLNLSEKKVQDMLLLRKYLYLSMNTTRAKELPGARIQGANRPDFKDSVNLFTITTIPLRFEEAVVSGTKKFKYVRYLSAKNHRANIAELEFIGSSGSKLNGKIIGFPEVAPEVGSPYQHAFDGDLKTYFSADTVSLSWTGLQFSKPEQLSKIRYCPRSDTNFIIAGDTYELKYWNGAAWTSFAKQVAANQDLVFVGVPSDAVYILRNLNEGNEERIFI